MATPAEVRRKLVEALRLDLVGPENDSPLAAEVLSQAPSRWYLTGFLVPVDAAELQRSDEESAEDNEEIEAPGATDDTAAADRAAAGKTAWLPSSIGLSFLAPPAVTRVKVVASWGDYELKANDGDIADSPRPGDTPPEGKRVWQRRARSAMAVLDLPASTTQPIEIELPDSGGLRVAYAVRPVGSFGLGSVSAGTRSVAVFVVNKRKPAPDLARDAAFAFQARLEVEAEAPLAARPDLRGSLSDDPDERIADLQYRDACDFASGHGVATEAVREPDGSCHTVRTAWIPETEVEHVVAAEVEGVELGMEALAAIQDGADAASKLGALPRLYRAWIDAQRRTVAAPARRAETAADLLNRAQAAGKRIERGIELLADPLVREAFQAANRAVAMALRRRVNPRDPSAVKPPAWRPFQLAFVLMNLAGIARPEDSDRRIVDLLFFPTGGGKTEAYLGLAAFALVLRRLRHPGIAAAGVTVLMRYTLRLLTLDQLGRAATLICALELEREKDSARLGEWPFEIGLWVGRAATPNRMGKKSDKDRETARARTIAFQNDDRKSSPIPLETCPWCAARFSRNSFRLIPNPDAPRDLRVQCVNPDCDFRRRPLPIVAVDEPIYRRLPGFLIATVDKFAALPWTGQVGALLGRVERHDKDGFYGPADPGEGHPLPAPLLPPDLVIQDELHLISGPMGTMAGLYETALDELCARQGEHATVRPKIVASTATVRRADAQIRALFGRVEVEVFPPPGPDRRDSFFARTEPTASTSGRLYVGVAAQGRSLKVVLLRAYRALLGAAEKAWVAEGGAKNPGNAADAYMTLVGYFNSLRELGGSRRIIADEVRSVLEAYGKRKRLGESEGLFRDRTISYDVVELTSRVATSEVSEAKRRLSIAFAERDHVDVAIATNMISVGLDITRLGLMVVLGQPKAAAEYIQATSRVGRDPGRPGLVVTLLNIHRPRDRSHYERFASWHESFYRNVEALSVTPFSRRALDRGLAGALVGLTRHLFPEMTPAQGAMAVQTERARLETAAQAFATRAELHARLPAGERERLGAEVRQRAVELLDRWEGLAEGYRKDGALLQYNERESGGARPLLYDFLDPELKRAPRDHSSFRAGRSLRDVEPAVNLWVRNLEGGEDPAEDDA